jgi:4-hydroxythreonine-4-phosphate dehydrogenase
MTIITEKSAVRLVITSGEPAGIGPDICLQLIAVDPVEFNNAELYILADPDLLIQRASQLKLNSSIYIHHNIKQLSKHYQPGKLNIIPLAVNKPCQTGKLNVENSAYVLKMLDIAHDLCQQGKVHAMVTGPVQKSIINKAGFAFTGHTEYLADKTRSKPVMMLATNKMRVALATTHLPLKDVSAAITEHFTE